MDNEIRPEFGNAPECPKGFTPNHKMDAANEEKRHYRSQWLAEKDRADALAAQMERIQDARIGLVPSALCPVLAEEIDSSPAISLARLKAECRREALHELLMHPRDATLRRRAYEMRETYRRQAEGGNHE